MIQTNSINPINIHYNISKARIIGDWLEAFTDINETEIMSYGYYVVSEDEACKQIFKYYNTHHPKYKIDKLLVKAVVSSIGVDNFIVSKKTDNNKFYYYKREIEK